MKSIWLILFLFIATSSHAQIDVFENEVEVKEGIIYYQNRPLTGKLFSNDETAIKNDCECTLEADYKNGKLYGVKKTYYPTGKLQFKGNYKEGKPVGKHIFLDENGKVIRQREYTSDGSYAESVYNEKGEKTGEGFYDVSTGEKTIKYFKDTEPVKEENYQNEKLIQVTYWNEGKKIKEETYTYDTPPLKIVKLFDENEIPIAQESYNTENGSKNGLWVSFDETGSKTLESIYKDDKIIKQQAYKDNQKHGKGFEIDTVTHIKKEFLFNNGKLVTTKTINPDFFVENYDLSPYKKGKGYYYRKLVVYINNPVKDSNTYFLLEIPDYAKYSGADKWVLKGIQDLILKRPKILTKVQYGGNKLLSGIIKIDNIQHKIEKKSYDWDKYVNDKRVKYKEWGYVATINFDIRIKEMGNYFKTYYFSGWTKSYSPLLSWRKHGLYPKNLEEAYQRAIKDAYDMKLYKFFVNTFPVYSQIKKITKLTSKGAKRVMIEGGDNEHVLKRSFYKIYDVQTREYKEGIKIIKTTPDKSFGKVTNNSKWLADYFKKHKNVYIKESIKE